MEQNKLKNHSFLFYEYLIYTTVATISLFTFFLIIKTMPIPLDVFLSKMLTRLYIPSQNICIPPQIGELNIQIFWCFFIIFLSLTSFLLYKILKNNGKNVSFPKIINNICVAYILIIALLQQISRDNFLRKQFHYLKGKTTQEKYISIAPSFYHYVEEVKNLVKGRHTATLLTDKKQDKDPYMFFHRALSYYLYPTISFRYKNNSKEDSIILFYKKNPLNYIPKEYKLIFASPDYNFIVAIKKDVLNDRLD